MGGYKNQEEVILVGGHSLSLNNRLLTLLSSIKSINFAVEVCSMQWPNIKQLEMIYGLPLLSYRLWPALQG